MAIYDLRTFLFLLLRQRSNDLRKPKFEISREKPLVLGVVAAVLVFVSGADGDTLTVRDGETKTVIRLAEIDAPERTQPYSQVSRRNLVALCREKAIELEKVDVDRYGRTVAHVRCNGIHVNWRQVEDGLAWCFTRYLKHPNECLPLERAAREVRRGLWGEAEPLAPWGFRAKKRSREN